MSYITKYGSFWGMLPQTSGNLFWVAPAASYTVEGRTYIASDDNDGLSPERAFLTLNRVFDTGKATANAGDVAVLLPGAHSWSATQTIDVAGVTITGLPRGSVTGPHDHGAGALQHVASITTTAGAAVLTITAADTEVAYLHVIPASAQAGIDLAATNPNCHDLTFNMTTATNSATFGISVSGATVRPRVANCYAYVSDDQGPWIRCAAATGSMAGGVIENNTVVLVGDTAWADVIEITTGVDNLVIRDCDFVGSSGALMTDVIDVTGNTSDHAVSVYRCFFPISSDPTEETATSDIALAQNWLAQIQGAQGGTAVV